MASWRQWLGHLFRKNDITAFLSRHGYDLIEEIGHGAFGTIHLALSNYRAVAVEANTAVAVKIIPHPKDYDSRRPLPADREYDVLTYIKDTATLRACGPTCPKQCPPNILCVYDRLDMDDVTILITEYFRAAATVDVFETATASTQIRLMYDMALAVQYLHSLGIAHRDIKPENILIDTRTYTIRIIDFGLACLPRASPSHRRVTTKTCLEGAGVGTPYFMSADIMTSTDTTYNVDHDTLMAADVWALGVTYYVLLTGHYPFDGQTYVDLVNAISGQAVAMDIQDDTGQTRSVPLALRPLIEGMLAKSKHDRWSMDQVVTYLGRLYTPLASSTPAVS